jgi:CHAD domain-containing protein
MTLGKYIRNQVDDLITGVARESAKADTSADGVHDLRVAIRRLSECLRVFDSVFPEGAADEVRGSLKVAMKQAAEVRNHDIASTLMHKAQRPGGIEIVAGRDRAAEKLASVLEAWKHDQAAEAWRDRLHG